MNDPVASQEMLRAALVTRLFSKIEIHQELP